MNVGVLGAMCSDVIHGPGDEVIYRGPGGIFHSLVALDQWLPAGDRVIPWCRVDQSQREMLLGRFGAHGRIADVGLSDADGPGYEAVLRYRDAESREECIQNVPRAHGLVDLAPELERVGAALFNFISGFEAIRSEIGALCAGVAGPVVMDVHSLCLDRSPGGIRFRRPHCSDWRTWLDGVTMLQMNGEEAGALAGCPQPEADPAERRKVAAQALECGVEAVVITLGANGSEIYDRGGMVPNPPGTTSGPIDPTGCGDVHAAALLAGLVRGLEPRRAALAAVAAATAQAMQPGCANQLPSWETLQKPAG